MSYTTGILFCSYSNYTITYWSACSWTFIECFCSSGVYSSGICEICVAKPPEWHYAAPKCTKSRCCNVQKRTS